MESQDSQINGTKTHPPGTESPWVPGCAGAALRGGGPRGSKSDGTATHAARKPHTCFTMGTGLFSLFGTLPEGVWGEEKFGIPPFVSHHWRVTPECCKLGRFLLSHDHRRERKSRVVLSV